MRFLVLFLFLIASESFAGPKVNCNVHRLYCTIVDLRPTIDKNLAMKLSNALYHYSNKYDMDPYLSIAIGMQESGLRRVNRTDESRDTALKCDRWGKCVRTIIITKEITDFGMFQFHINTVKRRKLDPRRLLVDVDYTVRQHLLYLRKKIKMCKKIYPRTAWACYHSATKDRHYKYVELVKRFYRGDKTFYMGN